MNKAAFYLFFVWLLVQPISQVYAQWVYLDGCVYHSITYQSAPHPQCYDSLLQAVNLNCPSVQNITHIMITSNLPFHQHCPSIYQYISLDGLDDLPNVRYLYLEGLNILDIPMLDSLRSMHLEEIYYSFPPGYQLPPKLEVLHYFGIANYFDTLPPLPNGLRSLTVHGNKNVNHNNATLPDSLRYFQFRFTTPSYDPVLGPFNDSLETLVVYGPLKTFPWELPPNLRALSLRDGFLVSARSQLSCVPYLHDNLNIISIDPGNIDCVPNYHPAAPQWMLNRPLCQPDDSITNPSNCPCYFGITGRVYQEVDSNCTYSGADIPITGAVLYLYDSSGTQVGTSATNSEGQYFFRADSGTYSIELDNSSQLLISLCNSIIQSGIQVTFSVQDTIDFGLGCASGADVEVPGINPIGWVAPGQLHQLRTVARDKAHFYGLPCKDSLPGALTLVVNGPVQYAGVPSGSLLPSHVSGDTIQYSIPNWALIDPLNDFKQSWEVDTTAQGGDMICVEAWVEITNGVEFDTSNNHFSFCYSVLNSYDPNDKLVSPGYLPLGATDYITYTVRFQNTGTGPAFNVRVVDTLSSDLNANSFEFLSASHDVQPQRNGSILTFKFNNIMLADSASDSLGSMGFVQFRVRPLPSISPCSGISNRAAIYFDYNPPIITNYSYVEIGSDLSAVDAIIDHACLPDTLGELEIVPLSGTPPFTYNLQGIGTSSAGSFSGLTSGKYYYQVTDSFSCSILDSVQVESSALSFQVNQELACKDSLTSVELIPQGTHPPYSFSSDGSNFTNQDSFPAFPNVWNYFWVRNSLGCVTEDSLNPIFHTIPDLVQYTAPCTDSSGMIVLTPSNGFPPFSYSINGVSMPPNSTIPVSSGNNYSIELEDDLGCLFKSNIWVSSPLSSLSTPPITCVGDTIVLTASQSSFSTLWNGTISASSFEATSPGWVVAEITDPLGNICVDSVWVVFNDLGASSTQLNIACSGDSTGIVQLAGTNGFPPYTFQFAGQPIGNVVQNLKVGLHFFAVSDLMGCTVLDSFEVVEHPLPISSLAVLPDTGSGGSISISPIVGTSPFQFALNGNGFSGNPTFSGLTPGNYLIQVVDGNGCIWQDSVHISNLVGLVEPITGIEIFPNPVNEFVTIRSDQGGLVELKVYSIDGKTLESILLDQFTNELNVNLDNWDGNIFMFQIRTTDGIHSKIIIKDQL